MGIKKIAVIGLGGVGGYFGFKLAEIYAQHKPFLITFIARGQTFTHIEENGLTLLSPEYANRPVHPDRLLNDVSELKDADLIILCVKGYDLENVCSSLNNAVTNNTIIIPLMNGIDIYERIRKIIPDAIVLPTCVYITSHIKEKGIVEHKGNPGKIITGADPLRMDYDMQEIATLFKTAGIQMDCRIDSLPYIWTKFFFIASFGLVTARYNKSIGQLLEEPELSNRVRSIMKEIESIAIKKKIALPANIMEETFQRAATFPYHTPTSLQLDVNSGKKHTELALFADAIINHGKALDLPVTQTNKIYNEIKEILN